MASRDKTKKSEPMENISVDTGNGPKPLRVGQKPLRVRRHPTPTPWPQLLESYRPLVELSPDPTILYDAEGCVIQVNAAFTDTFGWTTAELTGQRLDFVPEEARAQTADALTHLLREGKVTGFVSKRLTKNGTVMDVLSSAVLLKEEDGKVVGSVVNVRDHTLQKETERALQTSEGQYRHILESIEDGYYEVDLNGAITFMNDRLSGILGYSREELMGMDFHAYTLPETAERVYAAFNALFTSGKPIKGLVYPAIAKEGRQIFMEVSASLIQAASGRATGFRGLARDVTDRMQVETELRQSEARYRTIMESIEDGYYEADLDGTFTYINDQLCEVIGYPREQLLGMNYRQYATPETAERVFATFNQVFKTGEPVKGFVWEALDKNGRVRHLETYILLRHDEDGNPIGFRGVGRDISQRVLAEDALAEALIDQERIAAQLGTVAKVSTAVASLLDPQEMLQAVVDQVKESFNLYHAHVYLLNEAADTLELVAGSGQVGWQMVQEGRQIALSQEQSLVARAARSHSGVLVNNVRSDPGFLPHPLLPNTRAEMAVPMIVGGRLLGVIDIQADAVNHFSQRHVNIQTTLATQVAITLQNARLYAQAQRQTAELQETSLLLDKVIETMPVGLFMKDAHDLRIIRWNKENEELTGLPREAVLDMNDHDLFSKEQAEFFTTKDQEVLAGDELLDIPEETIDTPHRGQRILHTRKIAVLGADNKPRYLLGISEDITERKQAEAALRASQQRYRTILDNALDGVITITADSIITDWNPQAETIFGWTATEIIGRRLTETIIPAHYRQAHERGMAYFLKSGEGPILNRRIEIMGLHRNGREFPIELAISPIEADGQYSFTAFVQDISERKQAEEALRASQAQLQAVLENIPLGVFVADAKTGVPQLVNEAGIALLGRGMDPNRGADEYAEVYQTYKPGSDELLPVQELPLVQTMGDGQIHHGEVDIMRSPQDRITVDVISAPIFDGAGNMVSAIALFQDITERKKTQQAITRQAAIMDNAETFLGIGTLEGRVAYVNRYGAKLLGFDDPADVIGRHFAEFQPEAAEEFRTIVIPAILEKGFWRGESVMYAVDGRATPVDMTVSFLRDENGRPLGTATNAIDITAHKKTELALEAALAESERLYEMSAKLNATATVDEILQAVVLPVVAAGATAANLFTIDLDGNGRPEWIEMVSAWQDNEAAMVIPIGSRFYLPEFPGATAWIENPDAPVMIGNLPEDPTVGEATKALYAMLGVQATVTIPLRLGQQWVGLLALSWLTPQEFTGQQVRLYKSLADQTAVILNNRLLFEQTQKRAAELATVAEVGAAITTIRDVDELLQQVVDLTKERFALYHAHIYLLNRAENSLVLSSGAGDVGRRMVGEGRIIPLHQEQSLIARAARSRQGVIVNDVTADPGFLPNALLPQTKSEMAVPIVVADEVLGVLDVQGERTGRFSEEDIRTQTTLAAQIGVALQNARSFARSEAALQELEEVTRRLRREGWQSYLDTSFTEGMAYGYDPKQATPLKLIEPSRSKAKKKKEEKEMTLLARPLLVQGETIGKLMLTEPGSLEDDAADIMTAVAERLSAHIENLRLGEQTEQARQQAELLFQGSAALNTAQTYDDVLNALRQHTIIGSQSMNTCTINYFDRPWTIEETPQWVELLARWSTLSLDSLPMRFPFATFASMSPILQPDAPTLIEDIATDKRLEDSARTFFKNFFQAESFIFVPLVIGTQWVGFVNAIYERKMQFPEAEVRRLMTLSQQATVAIQSIRLFAQARARAERERQVRTITDKIRRGTDRENILRIAREELTQMLGASSAVVRLGSEVQLLAKTNKVDEAQADGRNLETEKK